MEFRRMILRYVCACPPSLMRFLPSKCLSREGCGHPHVAGCSRRSIRAVNGKPRFTLTQHFSFSFFVACSCMCAGRWIEAAASARRPSSTLTARRGASWGPSAVGQRTYSERARFLAGSCTSRWAFVRRGQRGLVERDFLFGFEPRHGVANEGAFRFLPRAPSLRFSSFGNVFLPIALPPYFLARLEGTAFRHPRRWEGAPEASDVSAAQGYVRFPGKPARLPQDDDSFHCVPGRPA